MNKKPFIKLFKSPNAYYVFDVNRDNVIAVSSDTYFYLQALLRNGDIQCHEHKILDEIGSLKNNGYLSDNKIKMIKHPCSDAFATYLERKLNMITLQVTQNCNLRCSYCTYSDFYNNQQRSHSDKRMSLETAIKAIDFLANRSIDSAQVNVGFYGGEPLLEFDLIKKAVSYAEDLFPHKELSFSITSNGTLLTPEILSFFREKNILLMISLDGPKEIHNINRRFAADGSGSFDVVMNNIRMIQKDYSDYLKNISISMVIDPQNDFDKINEIFEEETLQNVNIRPTVIDDTYSSEKIKFSERYIEKKEYNTFLAYLANVNRLNQNEVSPVAMQEITQLNNKIGKFIKRISLPTEGTHSGPCIPGQARLFVNTDGELFPCERISETSQIMQIGNLEKGFDYDKAMALLDIGALTADECRNCWAISHCSICPKCADDGDYFSAEMKISYCEGVKAQVLNELESMVLFQEINTFYKRGNNE